MIFLLLVTYQVKHFLADYPLQTPYMLGKFKPYPGFIKPLLAHSLVHGIMTAWIAFLVRPELALFLGLLDMTIHFVVDLIKANPKIGGRFKALSAREMRNLMENKIVPSEFAPASDYAIDQALKSNKLFWWALGLDQMAHHLSDLLIIWMLVS